MKKILFVLLFCVVAPYVGAWGLLPEFVKLQPAQYKQNNGYRKFLLYDIVSGRPGLRVCTSTRFRNKVQEDELFNNTQAAFSVIFRTVRNTIQNSGRAQEFQDFLSVWPDAFQLQRVVPPEGKECNAIAGKYDLQIKGRATAVPIDTGYQLEYGMQGYAAPQMDPKTSSWTVLLSTDQSKNKRMGIALHETAHLLGLADQYNNQDSDRAYSLAAFEDLTKIDSIMRAFSHSGRDVLTCDDVEGIINAVDFILRQEGVSSKRLENGWADLCGRNYVYIGGKPVRNNDPARAKQNRDAFARWAAAGYAPHAQPLFADKARQVQQAVRDSLNGLAQLEDKKRDITLQIESKSYELAHAKDYGWTAKQKQAVRQELLRLRQELKRLEAQTARQPAAAGFGGGVMP